MFADLTQPSGENLGDQPDVEPGAQLADGRHSIPEHFDDDMLYYVVVPFFWDI